MALVSIPEERQWSILNTSELLGNIYATRNVDFSHDGFIAQAQRTRYVGRQDTTTGTFGDVYAIVYGDFDGVSEKYWFVTENNLFTLAWDFATFAIDGIASSPSLTPGADGVTWHGKLWVSDNTQLCRLAAGTWTVTGIMALTSGRAHPVCAFDYEALFVGNGNEIKQLASDETTVTTPITVPSEHRIHWIRNVGGSVWFGTENTSTGYAKVYQWDGSSDNFNNEYDVDCTWVYSGVNYNGTLYIFTNDGRLMAFNGVGFAEAARLATYTDVITSTTRFTTSRGVKPANGLNVFQRGMDVIEGKIHVLVNAETVSGISTLSIAKPRTTAGIYVYEPNIGLHHKYGLSNSSAETDYGTGVFANSELAGVIAPILDNAVSYPASTVGSTLLYTCALQSNVAATKYYTVGSVTTGPNRSSFETTRVESPELQEAWRTVFIKYEALAATDSIVLKYRTAYRAGVPFTTAYNSCTWTNTTTFTSANTGFANAQVGDEVLILNGTGAGSYAHISAISYNAPTYTVTLDETITGIVANDTCGVIVDNYTKIDTITSTEESPNIFTRYAKISIPATSPSEWIMLKVEMRGEGVKISQLQLLSETQTKTII